MLNYIFFKIIVLRGDVLNNYTIYYHQNKTNGKLYIGITCQDVNERWGSSGHRYSKDQRKMYNAIKKYGWDGFYHEIYASGLSKEEACNMEKILIEKFDTIKNGYNITNGGDNNRWSDDMKKRMSDSAKKRFADENERIKYSKAGKDKYNEDPEGYSKKMREHKRKDFIRVVDIISGKKFECIADAARFSGLTKTGIARQCKMKTTNTKSGFVFRYEEDI